MSRASTWERCGVLLAKSQAEARIEAERDCGATLNIAKSPVRTTPGRGGWVRIINTSLRSSPRPICQDDSGDSGPTITDSLTIRPATTRTVATPTPPASSIVSAQRPGNDLNFAQPSRGSPGSSGSSLAKSGLPAAPMAVRTIFGGVLSTILGAADPQPAAHTAANTAMINRFPDIIVRY